MKFAFCFLIAAVAVASVRAGTVGKKFCPDVCPDVYNPVTDEDGKTYPNKCSMQAAKCKGEKKERESTSKESDSTDGSGSAPVSYCPNILCPAVYEPVTDENGVTYSNECVMKVAKCKGPHEDVLAEYKRIYGKSFGASRDAGDDEDDNSKPIKKCADACPDIVNTVCGSDGVKYANPCELKVAACKYPESNIVESACSKVTTQDDTIVRESSKSVKLQ